MSTSTSHSLSTNLRRLFLYLFTGCALASQVAICRGAVWVSGESRYTVSSGAAPEGSISGRSTDESGSFDVALPFDTGIVKHDDLGSTHREDGRPYARGSWRYVRPMGHDSVTGTGSFRVLSEINTKATGQVHTFVRASALADLDHHFDGPLIVWAKGYSANHVIGYPNGGYPESSYSINGISSPGEVLLPDQDRLIVSAVATALNEVTVDRDPDTAAPPAAQVTSLAQSMVIWGVFNNATVYLRPGASPENPSLPQSAPFDRPVINASDRLARSTNFAAFPVVNSTGLTEDAYFSLSTRINNGESSGALVAGYQFQIEDDAPFMSFRVPDAGLATQSLTMTFDSQTVPVVPGQVVEFGGAGVTEFVLRGFDTSYADPADDAFLYGLQFAELGVTGFFATAILEIPPGDFDENGIVSGEDFLAWQRAESPNNGSPEDLAAWQANFGEPFATKVAAQAVPEPEIAGLVFLAIVLACSAFRGTSSCRSTSSSRAR